MIERYTRPEMGKVWTRHNRYKAWLDVELAITEAWVQLGRVPFDALEEIRLKAAIDVERIDAIEEITRHDVIAFITSLEEKIGASARFIHLGCTSSDIVDTANALLIRQAGNIIKKDIYDLLDILKKKAFENKGVLCMGRTHGVHAEPTGFGLKLAGFYAEFERHRQRVEREFASLETGKISGAVGTYAFLSPDLEKKALQILGLVPDPHSTQIIQRDRYAGLFSALAIMGGGIERLAMELRHLQRTEVLEVEESFAQGQKGSSAMPHKKNPISAENLCGLSRVLRGNALAAMENQALWHERDISHSSVERIILPDSTILADYSLNRLSGLVKNLVVKKDKMLKNMDVSHGLYFSQKILTELVDAGMDRQKAYAKVQKLAMQSWENGMSFPAIVEKDAEINALVGKEKLNIIFDPAAYLKYEDYIFNRVFK